MPFDPSVVQATRAKQRLDRALSNVNPGDRQAIGQAALDSQNTVTEDPYYSKGRIPADVSTDESGVSTYTVAKGTTAVLFSYGVNDPLSAAGFPSALGQATYAETNLLHGSETNGPEWMVIDGIGLILTADNDPFFLRKITPHTFMSAGFGGAVTTYKWGPMLFWPGGSGLFGLGQDHFEAPALPGGQPQLSGSVTSGIPGAEDYAKQMDTIIWGPKGQADSTFSAQVLVTRQVQWTSTAVAAIGPRAATASKACRRSRRPPRTRRAATPTSGSASSAPRSARAPRTAKRSTLLFAARTSALPPIAPGRARRESSLPPRLFLSEERPRCSEANPRFSTRRTSFSRTRSAIRARSPMRRPSPSSSSPRCNRGGSAARRRASSS